MIASDLAFERGAMPRPARTAATTPSTLILTRRDIVALMPPGEYFAAVEGAFRARGEGRALLPPPMHVPGEGGTFHAKGASIELDRSYVAVKLNANFPRNPSECCLPTIQGVIALFDAGDGRLLSLLDSIEITLRRTAAASVLAARYLARSESKSIAICGCGEQGRAHLAALQYVLPLRHARLWDLDPAKASALARHSEVELGLETRVCRDHREATAGADIVVTCTSARTPFLTPADIAPGMFIAAVGADNPDKSEIEPSLTARARVVVDVLGQCAEMGDLHHAIAAGAMAAKVVHAELGDLVAGRRPGRTRENEIFLFDSTGTGIQDAASAVRAYERARAAGVGTSVDLGGA